MPREFNSLSRRHTSAFNEGSLSQRREERKEQVQWITEWREGGGSRRVAEDAERRRSSSERSSSEENQRVGGQPGLAPREVCGTFSAFSATLRESFFLHRSATASELKSERERRCRLSRLAGRSRDVRLIVRSAVSTHNPDRGCDQGARADCRRSNRRRSGEKDGGYTPTRTCSSTSASEVAESFTSSNSASEEASSSDVMNRGSVFMVTSPRSSSSRM